MAFGLATERSQVQIPAAALSCATVVCGQVVHTHCPAPLLLWRYIN